VAQAVEYFPSKEEALSSTLVTPKINNITRLISTNRNQRNDIGRLQYTHYHQYVGHLDKTNKDSSELIHTLDYMNLTDINRVFHPAAQGTNLTRRRREKIQINKISDEKGNIKTNMNEIQSMIREYSLETYTQINWKMGKFLDAFVYQN
jgi:hypothetical protein